MFEFLKKSFFSFCDNFSKKFLAIFSTNKLTDVELEQFFELLVSFDIGVDIARTMINEIKENIKNKKIADSTQLLAWVKQDLHKMLAALPETSQVPDVILLLGINGAGKTTTAAKIAYLLSSAKKKVLLVAADTYRAAAVDQLRLWAEIAGVELFIGKENADPASVIFDAGSFAENREFDHIIIDTAGRLHTNPNLLRELEKSAKITKKVFPGKSMASWVVLDAMLGQNSFQQVKTFGQAVKLDGIVLTKLDGSAKGGVIFAIAKNFSLPIVYITITENDLSGIKAFDPSEFIERMFCGVS